jgi:hypothetical protein
MTESTDTVVADTRRWLERAVIGLNLCPFAKSVHVKGQVHYAVSAATGGASLREDLLRELRDLAAIDPEVRDTTLLIAPDAFPDFLDFNHFLATADRALAELDLEGILQIAPFHPRFVFAGTRDDTSPTATNRSPYPTLHLLREDQHRPGGESPFPEAEAIFEVNMADHGTSWPRWLGGTGRRAPALGVGELPPWHSSSP